jgi:TonB-dependent starch-binding outer membrane protein SusC
MALGRQILFALVGGLLWSSALGAQGPTGSIVGRVIDSGTQQPVPGASVVIDGTQRGIVTRADGGFRLADVPAGQYRVRASRIGYGSQMQEVTLGAGATVTLQFSLEAEVVELAGVTAIGYGTRRREDVTGVIETVRAEEFNQGRIVSPEQLIQAKVAGVQVIDSGEPGGGVQIRIRGGTSVNASNEPLFVVDGVPLPAGGGLSAGRNPLNFINPEDIESVTVLKDASATAIYGSRGANGVILVQTKRGSSRAPQFSYNSSFSTSTVAEGPSMLSAEEFRAAVSQYAPERTRYLGSANTDWRDAVLQSATGQEHSIAVNGASELMNYRLSLGYLGQEGVVQGTQMDRVSAALNYGHRLFADRLNVQANLRGARTDDRFTPGGGIGAATIFDPTQSIRTTTGFFEQRDFQLAPNNPVAELALGSIEGTTYRSIANLEARYRMPFLDALSGTARVSYDVASSERRTFMPSVMWAQQKSDNPGYVSRSNPTETTGVLDAYLNYAARTGGMGEIDATAGYSYETSRGDYPFFEAFGLSTDLLGPNGVPTAEENVSRLSVAERRLASFFGRVNYTLLDRYLFTLSVRRDGSSRFGPENQWGTFPAAAFAWRLSDESFLADNPTLSELRLRASWGVNGNQAIGDYLWAADYRYGDAFTRAQFGNEFVTTVRPTAVDPNIKWEETTSWNLGLDWGLFSDRLTGSLEYYLKDTDDLLFRVPVAAGTYVSNFVTTNIGSVRNQGVELTLNARVLDGQRRGLTWTASLNAATNRNELLSINPFGGGGEQILTGGIAGGVGSNIQVLQPGFPVNSYFVFQHKRDAQGRPIYSENALEMYEDRNGDGIINQNDRAPFESAAPSWILGHSSQLGYGPLELGFTLRAHLGNYVYNNLASSQGFYGRLNEAAGPVNLHASVLENGFRTPQYFSDVYVEDASFLRMDNLTLSYTLPRNRALQQVRLFGTVQNVFTLTGYSGVDPEVGLVGIDNNIYPRSRTFTAGVNVGF